MSTASDAWFETTTVDAIEIHIHEWLPMLHLTSNQWLVFEGRVASPPTFPWQCRRCDAARWLTAEQAVQMGLVAIVSLVAPLA